MRRLGFAIVLVLTSVAVAMVQPLQNPWYRPLNPQGSSAGITYGTVAPSLASTGMNPGQGELWLDPDGATDGGPILSIYDHVTGVWDAQLSSAALTAPVIPVFNGIELIDSTVTDNQIDVIATGGLFTVGAAVDAADSILLDGNNGEIVLEGATGIGPDVIITATDPDTNLIVTFDNPPADTGGTWMELAGALAAQDAGDVWRGIYVNLDNPADHDGAAEIRAIELNADVNTATGTEYALWINNRFDAEIWFESVDPWIVYANTGNLIIGDAGGATSFILDDVPAAGASDATWSLVEIAAGLVPLDALDTQNGIFINLANADHTGGNVYGLNIDGVIEDPQAEEAAAFIGAGWDIDIHFGDATALVNWFETGGIAFEDYGGDISIIFEDVPDLTAADAVVNLVEIEVPDAGAIDAGDTLRGLYIDLTTNAGTAGGNFNGIEIDAIAPRAAEENAVVVGNGWDNDVLFENNQARLMFATDGAFRVLDPGAAVSFWLRDVPAAGTANDLMELDVTLTIMDDAGDIFRGLFLDFTSVDHTNGNIIGVDIDLDVPDTQATETAVYANGGWDYTLRQDGVAFADLPAVIVGAMVYCTNCDQASVPCATTGANGAWAFGTSNGPRWECPW